MKKVLFVATVTVHINAFHIPYLKYFKECGYEVHVASNGNEEIEYCDKHYNIPFERSPFNTKNFVAYKELKRMIQENDYDIIHCHTPVGGVITRLAARKARKNKRTKVIYTAHGFHFYNGAPKINWIIYYPIEKFLSKYTDCIITINNEDYKFAKNKMKSNKVEYIPGVGIDLKKFNNSMEIEEKEKIKKKIGINKDDFICICVGELNKNKNQIVIIEAMRKIVEINNKIKVLLVGKGEKQEFYKSKIKEYQLENNVLLLGYRKDVDHLMKVSDILISASIREGLPVNVIEAMAASLPIIASKIRGNVDLVQDGKNGYLFEYGDSDKLAELIMKMYNENLMSKKKSSLEISKKYDIENVLKKAEEIYNVNVGDKPIRILQIIRTMNIGGAETFLMNIYRNIDKEKVQFDFLVNGNGKYDDEIKKMGGNIYQMPYITDIGQRKYLRNLKKFFNEYNYKIVHSHIDQVSGIILYAAKKAGTPIRISHSHNTQNTNSIIGKIYKKYLQSKILPNATNYFACGNEAAKWLYKDKANEAIIINNGIDVEKFKFSEDKRNKIREELNLDENVTLIGHIGRFSTQKNHTFLIDIFNQLVQINPNVVLALVGEGVLREEIEQKVKKLNLQDKVKFLGLRKDTDYLYSAFDCMVFPSLHEGLSLVLIEAQTSGLKVFASDNVAKETDMTGMMEFISLKETDKQWAEYIEKGKCARNTKIEKIEEKYDAKRVAEYMSKVYIQLYEDGVISEDKEK